MIDKKSLDRWFNTSLLMLLLITFLNSLCRHPYHTNPDLRLLVGDTLILNDSIHYFNPVISPKDKKVYYLGVPWDSVYSGLYAGSIYTINFDGTDNKKFLEGKFRNIAISQDGEKLAVSNCRSYFPFEPESLILIINTTSMQMDSFWVSQREIEKIEWGRNGDYLYYSFLYYTYDTIRVRSLIYRLHLSSATEEFIDTFPRVVGFDLFNNDSLYLDPVMAHCQINPIDNKYAIGIWSGYEFLMRNIETNKLDTLRSFAQPYARGKVDYPYWHPEENTIIFMAREEVGHGRGTPGEIWILGNVFEYIKEQ
jgi:hypothetical protein|uniref:Dipeptidylpeptidase IV N-terminal domain-containing protein n=1 Tax=candidate division WOR-3 bacterium TaxID=2052148 RepID=A0A7C6AA78_UNCW3